MQQLANSYVKPIAFLEVFLGIDFELGYCEAIGLQGVGIYALEQSAELRYIQELFGCKRC
ncbi:MAG: hypothetical protein KKC86_15025 [Bacteroidetes bacterium]|nr:hypothetical protein [Bacteroidota bacterium]